MQTAAIQIHCTMPDSTCASLNAKRGWQAAAKRLALLLILLPCCFGCQVIGIPSYRADDGCGYPVADMSTSSCSVPGGFDSECAPFCESQCPPGIIPPLPVLPGWLAEWRMRRAEEKARPQAPEYPRYHPLPTRPMFSPRKPDLPTMPQQAVRYGQMQSPEAVEIMDQVVISPAAAH